MPIHSLRFYMVVLIAGVLGGGCQTVPSGPAVPTDQKVSLKEMCERNNVIYYWDSILEVATLTVHDVKTKIMVDSPVVLWGDKQIILSAPVQMTQSMVIVPADFQSKVIDQKQVRPQKVVTPSYSYRKLREVILDPGHGGKDPGAVSKRGTREKDIVLDIARRVKKQLEQRGIKVRMTRNKDIFISLQERTEIACRSKADLFVSIHANSNPNRSTQGMEVYTLQDLTSAEMNEEQRQENYDLLFKHLAIKPGQEPVEDIIEDLLYGHKQADSRALANQLSQSVCRLVKIKNGGVKHAHFYVLRNTFMPSILVETGYLTNPQEERLLKTGSHRQKIAEGIAESILKYSYGK